MTWFCPIVRRPPQHDAASAADAALFRRRGSARLSTDVDARPPRVALGVDLRVDLGEGFDVGALRNGIFVFANLRDRIERVMIGTEVPLAKSVGKAERGSEGRGWSEAAAVRSYTRHFNRRSGLWAIYDHLSKRKDSDLNRNYRREMVSET